MPALRKKFLLAAGLTALAAALLPPLNTWSEQLFAAHMGQHLILIAVSAPLLALSGVVDDALRFAHIRVPPLAAWCSFVGTFLFWHWPAAFQWAAQTAAAQTLELASIFLSACLFWNTALSECANDALGFGGRALYVTTAAVLTDLPGVVMVFAASPICVMPHENAGAWGLSPLEDQEIAGMLMWVPANLVFFGFALLLLARWLNSTSGTPANGQATNGQTVNGMPR